MTNDEIRAKVRLRYGAVARDKTFVHPLHETADDGPGA